MPGTGVHAAQEQVESAADVPLVVVIAQAGLQVAVESEQIQQVLKPVAMFAHRGAESFPVVVLRRAAEPVRFVVEHVPAAPVLESEIDEAAQEAVDDLSVLLAAQQPGVAVAFEQIAEGGAANAVHREGELEFGKAAAYARQQKAFLSRFLKSRFASIFDHGPGDIVPARVDARELKLLFADFADFAFRLVIQGLEDSMQATAHVDAAGKSEGVEFERLVFRFALRRFPPPRRLRVRRGPAPRFRRAGEPETPRHDRPTARRNWSSGGCAAWCG